MKYFRLFLYMITSALMFYPQPGRSDITPMDYSPPASGGGVSPKSPHPTIRLDDQEVIIRLKNSTYTVDAVFHLSNTGETTTEWIGFPNNPTGRSPGPLGGVMDFIRFQVSVNEMNVPFTEERNFIKSAQNLFEKLRSHPIEHSRWLMGRATFPGHAKTTIRVNYETYYGSCGFLCDEAVYIYGTGGYWKDRIGRASFIVHGTHKGSVDRGEAPFSASETDKYLIHRRLISENVAKYEIKNFEPNPDGALQFRFTSRRVGKDDYIYALNTAALNGRLEQARFLLNEGVAINAKTEFGDTALMSAAWGGHLEVAKLLLEKGADVNAETKSGQNALYKAMENAWTNSGQIQVAQLLRENGAKPTTLATAAFVGDVETTQRLIEEGADLNQTTKPDDQTMLMAAAMGGHSQTVKLLLDKGLKINATDKRGKTALIMAANGGHAEVVQVLLDRGADINARDDPANRTILMHAAQGGRLDVVKLLLEKGADVNARDNGGKTALSLAQGKDIEEIEKVLKAHGARK